MSKQKSIEGEVPTDDREGVEVRVVRDQKEVRHVLGDKIMDGLLDQAHTEFKGHTSRVGSAFVFLVFTEEGKGTVWLSDCDEQDIESDEDALTVKKKMRRIWGPDMELRYWLAAKKLKGWTD
jgi:hypothetical protein